MIHDFAPITDRQNRPRVKCQREECGLEVIAWPNVDLANVFPACGAQWKIGGVGSEFAALVKSFGLDVPCDQCQLCLLWMNYLGPDGCEEHRAGLVVKLRENEKHLGWGEWLKAGARAALAGYTSLESLLDEAIRRARRTR